MSGIYRNKADTLHHIGKGGKASAWLTTYGGVRRCEVMAFRTRKGNSKRRVRNSYTSGSQIIRGRCAETTQIREKRAFSTSAGGFPNRYGKLRAVDLRCLGRSEVISFSAIC
jgi:hypothetical protein